MPRPLLLTSLLLLDLWSWDDELPPGDGVGSQVSHGEDTVLVVGWEDGIYQVAPVFQVPVTRAWPLLTEPVVRRYGKVDVEVREGPEGLVGTPVPATVEIARLGLTVDEGIVPVDSLAPFAVHVDAATGAIAPSPVDLPDWPLLAGMAVRADGVPAVVITSDGTVLTVRARDPRPAPDLRIRNPDDVRFPLAWLLGGVAVLAVIVAWTRRLNVLLRPRVR